MWRNVLLWPRRDPYLSLSDVVDLAEAPPLSARGTAGFFSRAQRASLTFDPAFLHDIADHAKHMAESTAAA